MVPLMLLAGIMVASQAAQAFSQYQSEQSSLEGIKTQTKEQQLQYKQKSLQNLDAVQKMLDAQVAWQSVSGNAFSSPTFNAIQRNTANQGARMQRNLETEENIIESNLKTEKGNVKSRLYSQLFGDVTSAASAGANIAEHMPSFGS